MIVLRALIAVVYLTSLVYGLARLCAFIARPPKRLPVFSTVDPNARIALGFGGVYLMALLILLVITRPSVGTILAGVVVTVGGVALSQHILSRDSRRYGHLLRVGHQVRLRVLRKTNPTHGGPQCEFVLTAFSAETGERDLRVGPSTYHSFHEGEELDLLLDPSDPDCWQILRPKGAA